MQPIVRTIPLESAMPSLMPYKLQDIEGLVRVGPVYFIFGDGQLLTQGYPTRLAAIDALRTRTVQTRQA